MPRFRFLIYVLLAFGGAGFYFFDNDVPMPPWHVWAIGLVGGAAHVWAYKDKPNSFRGMPTWVGILVASTSIAGFALIAIFWLALLHPEVPLLTFLTDHPKSAFGAALAVTFVFTQWLINRKAPSQD